MFRYSLRTLCVHDCLQLDLCRNNVLLVLTYPPKLVLTSTVTEAVGSKHRLDTTTFIDIAWPHLYDLTGNVNNLV